MGEKRLSPELRFPEFEDFLIQKQYGDIYSFYTTNSFSRDKLNYEKGEVYNIHYGDIHTKFYTGFDLEKENVPFVDKEVDLLKIKEECYCQEGDLVIADASEDYNDIGKTIELLNLDNKKVLAGLHTFLARPNKYNMATGFASYLLQTWKVRKQVMTISQGTKVLSLSTGRLSKIKLDIPSFQEQQKIATFLTSVDQRLQLLEKKKAKLEAYKKGVMQQIFSQEVRFKIENEVGELVEPPDWEEKKLGEIAKITTGKLDANAMVEKGKYRFYTCAKDFYFIDEFAFDFEALLISGNGANVGYVHYYKGKFNAYQRTYILYNIEESYLFIKFFLDINLQRRIHKEKKDGNTPYIVINTLADMIIKIPCIKEQQKIATFLSSIDKNIAQITQQIEKSKSFKKGLLQKMFALSALVYIMLL